MLSPVHFVRHRTQILSLKPVLQRNIIVHLLETRRGSAKLNELPWTFLPEKCVKEHENLT